MLGRVSESGLIPVNPDQLSLRRLKRGAAAAAVFGLHVTNCDNIVFFPLGLSFFSLHAFPSPARLHGH